MLSCVRSCSPELPLSLSVLVCACLPVSAHLQINMYEGGGRPAAASYASYLTSDASPEGRPDRYGLREWRHDSSGALWSVSTCLTVT
jgi:hypothetical protein